MFAFLTAALIVSPTWDPPVVADSDPSIKIYCPLFHGSESLKVDGKTSPDNFTFQRDMCYSKVVKPMEKDCIAQGHNEIACMQRTLRWLILQKIRRR
jgi:glycerol kinase